MEYGAKNENFTRRSALSFYLWCSGNMFNLVLYNARIFGNEDADTVAVKDGRIVYVGPEAKFASSRAVDLHGMTLTPGFIDSHTHLLNLGLSMNRLDLSRETTRDMALEKTREYAHKSNSKIVVGYGWDETAWGEKDYITDRELDFTEKPIMLYRKDMHMAVLNSSAMKLAGISSEAGVFSEESMREVQWLSKPDDAELAAALKSAGGKAASEGITAVRDIMEYRTMEFLRKLDFPVRVFGALYDREYGRQNLSNECWWGIKAFLDGSIGSRSAAHEGWAQDNLKFTPEALRTHLERFWNAGMPVAMHAIGELATSQAVEALSGQKGSMRNSIEHFELVEPETLEKVGESTILSSQPNFLQWSGKGGLYESTLGKRWYGKDNPFRIILDSGKHLAFGSDTMPIGPNYGIGLAVNTPHARQKITLQEAVNAYTEGSAFLLNRECCMGRIQEGYFADLVIQGEKYVSETKVIGTRKPVATIRGGILTFGTWESIGSNSQV